MGHYFHCKDINFEEEKVQNQKADSFYESLRNSLNNLS